MPMTVEQQPDAQARSWVRNQLEAASVATAYRLADLYAVSDIECNGVEVAEADRFREEFGHEAETKESADHEDESDKNGENTG